MSTRERIVAAAAHVMHTRGLAHATTKEIAKESGYSEATLYKNFRDKTDLFLAVLLERTPGGIAPVLDELSKHVGREPVRDSLVRIAVAAIDFYGRTFPMAASLFSEPALLAAHREAMLERNVGPQYANKALAAYLATEQEHGNLRADIDPYAAASLLLGACFQHAFLRHFTEPEPDPPEVFAAAIIDTLLAGLGLAGR